VSVTVVIPAKNEARTVAELIARARPYADEIIVMDGHSTDDTRRVAAERGARVELDGGSGKGEAIRRGIDLAAGEIIVLIDSDGSHDPDDIPRLVEPVRAGRADLVVGCRLMGGSDELHGTPDTYVRFVGSMMITLAINYRWNVRLGDVENGFRAIRRTVARAIGLRANVSTIEQEMVMKCLKGGYRVTNVAAHEYARRFGRSHIRLWRMWPAFVWSLLWNLR
jgi:dolichol-phosphate mannosyltransferase